MPENHGFLGLLKSLFGGKEHPSPAAAPAGVSPQPANQPAPAVTTDSSRVYGGALAPERQLYIWGRDSSDNPSFLMLCGQHGLQRQRDQHLLEEAVSYTHYIIFRGNEGHFPAFEALKVIESTDYSTRERARRLYNKRDIRGSYHWADPKKAIAEFTALTPAVSLPYFEKLSHRDVVQLLKTLRFPDFMPVEEPGEILRLPADLLPYQDTLVTLLASPNLYLRKKALKTLREQKPPKALWQYLLQIGSSELVAGLFLEMAGTGSDLLLQEARDARSASHTWAAQSYADGIRRTAAIYVNSHDPHTADKRLAALRETLPELRFFPLKAGGRSFPPDKPLEGAAMRRLAYQGVLSEHCYSYDREQRKSIKLRREGLYPQGYYCDGVVLDRIKLKNTIQEAQTYGGADIIGKVAYYLDAPGLVYYFKCDSRGKALRYFQRLLSRIINVYAATDEDRFMEAMVALLTGYTADDYCCKYKGNFQFNRFIKQYLYASLDHTAPTSWRERHRFMAEDQLRKAEARCEYRPDIWNRHLDRVLEIALHAQVEVVLKAVYFILNDPVNLHQLEAGLSYEQLLNLSDSVYEPISQLGVSLISRRLAAEPAFNASVVATLMCSRNVQVGQLAQDYFRRAAGAFTPTDLARLLLLPELESWEELLCENIAALDGDAYLTFLYAVFDSIDKLQAVGWEAPRTDILYSTLAPLHRVSAAGKAGLLIHILELLRKNPSTAMTDLAGRVLFTLPPEELRTLLAEPQTAAALEALSGGMVAPLLQAVRQNLPPADSEIAAILESGCSQMVRTLAELLEGCTAQLATRFSTVLLLLESEQSQLNNLAKAVFEGISGEPQQKLHAILLDSPHEQAYSYALEQLYTLYESREALIPQEFIVGMLEHTAPQVKSFIASKIRHALENLGGGDSELFLYYAKTLLLLPNRLSGGKDQVYAALPLFVRQYGERRPQVEALLLEIGGSNIICDSERALIALAGIRKEAV